MYTCAVLTMMWSLRGGRRKEGEGGGRRKEGEGGMTYFVTCVLMVYCRVLMDWRTSIQPRY